MISAAEARQQVKEGNTELAKEARELINTKVTEAVKKGQSTCYVYGTYQLLKQAEKEAFKAGYRVVLTDCQRDGPMLKLDWSR